MPSFRFERACAGRVAGIDEAGRGPLAGPVVAAVAVIDRAAAKRTLLRESVAALGYWTRAAKIGVAAVILQTSAGWPIRPRGIDSPSFSRCGSVNAAVIAVSTRLERNSP